MVIDVLAIRFVMDKLRLHTQHAKQLRSTRTGRTIGAIDHDFALDPGSRYTPLQPSLIAFAQTVVSGQRLRARGLGRERRPFFNQTENLLLDREFELVRKLVSIAAKDFDSVVGPRIMRSR